MSGAIGQGGEWVPIREFLRVVMTLVHTYLMIRYSWILGVKVVLSFGLRFVLIICFLMVLGSL